MRHGVRIVDAIVETKKWASFARLEAPLRPRCTHQVTNMPIPFLLLSLAVCLLWVPPLSISGRYVPAWCPAFSAAVIAGLLSGALAPVAVLWLGMLCAMGWGTHIVDQGWRSTTLTVLTAVAALVMSLHKLPGFHNPAVFVGFKLTLDATPFTLYFNFDKGAAGLVILASLGPKLTRIRAWPALLPTTLMAATITSAVAIGAAVAVGFTRFEPKAPGTTLVFLLTNLLFTCVAEEAFFRGLIQARLTRLAEMSKRPWLKPVAIGLSAILFGLVHVSGGGPTMVFATLAGLGYAMVYERTSAIEAPILVHFALNTIHFLLFTYPSLAR